VTHGTAGRVGPDDEWAGWTAGRSRVDGIMSMVCTPGLPAVHASYAQFRHYTADSLTRQTCYPPYASIECRDANADHQTADIARTSAVKSLICGV